MTAWGRSSSSCLTCDRNRVQAPSWPRSADLEHTLSVQDYPLIGSSFVQIFLSISTHSCDSGPHPILPVLLSSCSSLLAHMIISSLSVSAERQHAHRSVTSTIVMPSDLVYVSSSCRTTCSFSFDYKLGICWFIGLSPWKRVPMAQPWVSLPERDPGGSELWDARSATNAQEGRDDHSSRGVVDHVVLAQGEKKQLPNVAIHGAVVTQVDGQRGIGIGCADLEQRLGKLWEDVGDVELRRSSAQGHDVRWARSLPWWTCPPCTHRRWPWPELAVASFEKDGMWL